MADIDKSRRLHSGEYVANYERKPISRIKYLVPFLKLRGDEALADFACGNAMLLPLIHERIATYYGVDFSPDFIEAAQARAAAHDIRNCSFHCEDIEAFCSRHPAEFDVATAFDFSEHIDDDDFRRIFRAIRECLKPGGRLLMHTPNLAFFIERLKDIGVLRQFPEHIAVRTAAANRSLLCACGFADESIRIHEFPHYNFLRALHPLRHMPFAGRLFVARLVIECVR